MPALPRNATSKAKKKLKELMKLPKARPHPFLALCSLLSGTALSWGVEVFDAEKVKEQAIQEATNTGLLTALLLTISAGPLLGDAPQFLEGVQWRHDVWFLLWFLSTMFLGLATIVAVMQNVMFATLSGDQIRYFHDQAGVTMHSPLLLFICGTLLLLAAICFALFFSVSRRVWVGGLLTGLLLLIFLLALVTRFMLWCYDCYAMERAEQENTAAEEQSSVEQDVSTANQNVQPVDGEPVSVPAYGIEQ